MRRVKTESSRVVFAASLLSSIVFAVATCSTPVSNESAVATSVTVFEGARLIVGDGSTPIENAVFIIDDTRFVQVGRSNSIEIPPDAARVDLTGRTVMPAIIDTHVHLRETREELVEDLFLLVTSPGGGDLESREHRRRQRWLNRSEIVARCSSAVDDLHQPMHLNHFDP